MIENGIEQDNPGKTILFDSPKKVGKPIDIDEYSSRPTESINDDNFCPTTLTRSNSIVNITHFIKDGDKKRNNTFFLCSSLLSMFCSISVIISVVFLTLFLTNSEKNSKSVAANDDDVSGNSCHVPLYEVIQNSSSYISLSYTTCPSLKLSNALEKAVKRWSDVIKENKITPTFIGAQRKICNRGKIRFGGDNRVLNSLVVIVSNSIKKDKVDLVVESGPCFLDEKNIFPILGVLNYNRDEITKRLIEDHLDIIIMKSIGHILGIGTLWGNLSQNGVGGFMDYNFNSSLLKPVNYSYNNVEYINRYYFSGINAHREFLSYVSESQSQTFQVGNINKLYTDSKKCHWSSSYFKNEIMTNKIEIGVKQSLSRISIGALEDLGYSVDYSQDDDYQLLSTSEETNNNIFIELNDLTIDIV